MPKLISPSVWYLAAALPLTGTYALSVHLLEEESLHYRLFGGLRPVFVLGTVRLASVLGFLAVVSFGLFIGSAFTPKLHAPAVLKLFSLVALFTYGLWSFQATLWIMMMR